MPLFVQVQGGFGLYAEPWTAPQGLGVPIGFLAAALLLLPDLAAMRRPLPLSPLPRRAIGLLCAWVFLLGVSSAWIDPVSLLYALQWIAPVCLISYLAVVVQAKERLRPLLSGLRLGTAFASAYLVVLFLIEWIGGGGMEGRITQNRFFPGMYQLYNYVPVGLTLAGLFCAGLSAQLPGLGNRRAAWAFLMASAMVPLLTGARDPALLFLVVAPFPAWWLMRARGLAVLAVGCAILISGLTLLVDGDLLVLRKFHAMFATDADVTLRGMVGNRAGIMAEYGSLVERHPVAGTRMLPPWILDPDAGVTAKGAHNYYLDTLAWAGPIALLAVLGLALSTLSAVPRLLFGSLGGPTDDEGSAPEADLLSIAARAAAAPAAGLLLISSNLRTPLREPISAMVGYMLIGLVLCWAFRTRRV
jgi:hypothetical protein